MKTCLLIAAIYNLAWGAFAIFAPRLPFQWLGIDPPNYPSLWQCIGMIVGVYGVGYAIAAYDTQRHWPTIGKNLRAHRFCLGRFTRGTALVSWGDHSDQ
jgi:hypothetical protein